MHPHPRLLLAVVVALSVVVLACDVAVPPWQTPTPPPTQSRPAPTPASTTAPARPVALVLSVTVSEVPVGIPDYDRGEWDHWNDADRDCQDARQEVLIAESSVPVVFKDDVECRVESGRWTDPYTGTTVEDPGKLDVDHLVPLANAHVSGGHAWDGDRKALYANSLSYPEHLIAVTASANRSKGASGPDEWRPPDNSYWCRYATDWIAVKKEWGLTVTRAEASTLDDMLDTCDHNVFLQVTDAPADAPTPTPIEPRQTAVPAQTATPTPESDVPDTKYDPQGEDRNCSDFDTWALAQAFYEAAGGPETDRHRLDRDGNGVACETLPGAPG